MFISSFVDQALTWTLLFTGYTSKRIGEEEESYDILCLKANTTGEVEK